MIKFDYSANKCKFIIENIVFNEPKKEREVFEMAVKGYNNTEIGSKIGLSEKSVYRRKKELQKKILRLW